jgi:hypothetical protein
MTKELPGWVRAAVFATTMLAITWLMMWVASRR